jgi:hypothetical protein
MPSATEANETIVSMERRQRNWKDWDIFIRISVISCDVFVYFLVYALLLYVQFVKFSEPVWT